MGPAGVNGKNGIGASVAQLPPAAGGHAGPGGAVVTAGDGVPAYVCNGQNGTTGQGADMATSGNFLFPTATTTDVPDLSLGVIVTDSTAAVVVSTDGGVQVNSAVAGQYVIVDIFLFVDCPSTPASSAPPSRSRAGACSRRTPSRSRAIANWSFSVVDVRTAGRPCMYTKWRRSLSPATAPTQSSPGTRRRFPGFAAR